MVRVSKERRALVKERLLNAIDSLVDETTIELRDQLGAAPYAEITDELRVRNLLIREAYKIMIDLQLKQDGNRAKLKRDALGTPCPFCDSPMIDLAEMELDHECYDGRPPRPVHKGCHKKHQPH